MEITLRFVDGSGCSSVLSLPEASSTPTIPIKTDSLQAMGLIWILIQMNWKKKSFKDNQVSVNSDWLFNVLKKLLLIFQVQ